MLPFSQKSEVSKIELYCHYCHILVSAVVRRNKGAWCPDGWYQHGEQCFKYESDYLTADEVEYYFT